MTAIYIFIGVIVLYLVLYYFFPNISFTKNVTVLIVVSILSISLAIYLLYVGVETGKIVFPIFLLVGAIWITLKRISESRNRKSK